MSAARLAARERDPLPRAPTITYLPRAPTITTLHEEEEVEENLCDNPDLITAVTTPDPSPTSSFSARHVNAPSQPPPPLDAAVDALLSSATGPPPTTKPVTSPVRCAAAAALLAAVFCVLGSVYVAFTAALSLVIAALLAAYLPALSCARYTPSGSFANLHASGRGTNTPGVHVRYPGAAFTAGVTRAASEATPETLSDLVLPEDIVEVVEPVHPVRPPSLSLPFRPYTPPRAEDLEESHDVTYSADDLRDVIYIDVGEDEDASPPRRPAFSQPLLSRSRARILSDLAEPRTRRFHRNYNFRPAAASRSRTDPSNSDLAFVDSVSLDFADFDDDDDIFSDSADLTYQQMARRLASMPRDFGALDHELLLQLDERNWTPYRSAHGGISEEILRSLHFRKYEAITQPASSTIVDEESTDDDDDSLQFSGVEACTDIEIETVTEMEVERCGVCLQDYEDGMSLWMLPCHHEFCECVGIWLVSKPNCPLCRCPVYNPDRAYSQDTEYSSATVSRPIYIPTRSPDRAQPLLRNPEADLLM
jgi:Ring finger domain